MYLIIHVRVCHIGGHYELKAYDRNSHYGTSQAIRDSENTCAIAGDRTLVLGVGGTNPYPYATGYNCLISVTF